MVEPAGSLYSDDNNAAIRERIGSKAPNALYIEELDIDAYYDRLRKAGRGSSTPSHRVPGGSASSRSRTAPGTG
jgi:hypothetical protein